MIGFYDWLGDVKGQPDVAEMLKENGEFLEANMWMLKHVYECGTKCSLIKFIDSRGNLREIKKPISDHVKLTLKDPINPDHYGGKDNPYEAIKVIEAWGLGFCLGNTVKYIARAGKKGDALEDLKKAKRYIEMEIEKYGK